MAYDASEWANGAAGGTPITAEALNKIENGIADAHDAAAESPSWAEVTGKPSTFAPSTHAHTVADVTGLQSALDGKQASGSYAAASHTHTIADVTGLQAALDALSLRLDALEEPEA